MSNKVIRTSSKIALLALCSAILISGCGTLEKNLQFVEGVQIGHHFKAEVVKEVRAQYLLYLPTHYEKQDKWPLILSLHGSSLRGNRLDSLRTEGIPHLLDIHPGFRFIVLSPLCPAGELWSEDTLITLLDDVIDRYKVDEDRVYLTGYDLGGFAAWNLAMKYPDRFAAAAPISAGGNEDDVCRMKNVPVWVIHGADDKLVPASEARKMVEALKACGGSGKFTVYPDTGHDAWTETYMDVDLYIWFLEQVRNRTVDGYSVTGSGERVEPRPGIIARLTGRK